MTNSEAMGIMMSALVVAIKIGGPILLLSMAIGVLISIIQAATQIHEQTITFVPKVMVIGLICIIFGSWMLEVLQDFFYNIIALMLK